MQADDADEHRESQLPQRLACIHLKSFVDVSALQATCANTNGDSANPVKFSCTRGVYNSAWDGNNPPSIIACCQPSCSDTTPNNNARPQPYACSSMVQNQGALVTPTPASDANCCLQTCLDTDVTTPGTQSFNCGMAEFNSANTASTTLSPSACCTATCGYYNLAGPGTPTHWPCTRGAYDSSKGSTTNPTDSACCQPTCGDTDLSTKNPTPFPDAMCAAGQQYDPGTASTTQPSPSKCCKAIPPPPPPPAGSPPSLSVAINGLPATIHVGSVSNITITVSALGSYGSIVSGVMATVTLPSNLTTRMDTLPAGKCYLV